MAQRNEHKQAIPLVDESILEKSVENKQINLLGAGLQRNRYFSCLAPVAHDTD